MADKIIITKDSVKLIFLLDDQEAGSAFKYVLTHFFGGECSMPSSIAHVAATALIIKAEEFLDKQQKNREYMAKYRQPKIASNEPPQVKEEKEPLLFEVKPIEKSKVSKCFVKPSIDEVRAYIKEKAYNVNAEQWWDFYESKGWFVGKNKMKDWKAAIRTWARGDGRSASTVNDKKRAAGVDSDFNSTF